ncbi:HTH domain-containing protein [Streptomyces sp. MBT49]|uniref:HTH domain-containing protein n=1 Tax=Streptomyces sp. MBT49 TaxID=1488380 RepID=UPI00190C83D0|nr:HTH domain-containing protein [Streptomyces sp. MBT49]MBK3630408.1 HTH domain-containing protein [Streptomyces sp. MBT49]
MSPATARDLRRKQVAELRAAEPDLSLRQMADRLGLSRDTVTRDLAEIDRRAAEDAPPAEGPELVADAVPAGGAAAPAPVDDPAPQVTAGGRAGRVPAGEASAAPVAQVRPPADLPRRVAQPLAGMDLSQWPAVRRDLARLAQTGRSAEAMAHQAIVALAHHYAQAVARGDLEVGQEFVVTAMDLRPLPRPAAREGEPAPV